MVEPVEQGGSPSSVAGGRSIPPADDVHRVQRMIGRAVLIMVGLVVVVGGAIASVEMAKQLHSAPPRDGRMTAMLSLVGTVLRSLGLGAVMIGQAMVFRSLAAFMWPFTSPPGSPRSHHGRRVQRRQIRGASSWTPGEVPSLRAQAAWQLSVPTTPRLVAAGIIVFSAGMALAPINLPGLFGVGSLLGRFVQVLAAGLLVVYVSALICVRSDRRSAQKFLDDTFEAPN